MTNPSQKEHHEKRILQKDRHIKRQIGIRKGHGLVDDQAHRYHKMSGMNCGNANCVLCTNPRRTFKELTIQEKSFIQTQEWDDTEDL